MTKVKSVTFIERAKSVCLQEKAALADAALDRQAPANVALGRKTFRFHTTGYGIEIVINSEQAYIADVRSKYTQKRGGFIFIVHLPLKFRFSKAGHTILYAMHHHISTRRCGEYC